MVARGELDIEAAAGMGRRLARLQLESGVYVDVWNVDFIDPLGVQVLDMARKRAAAAGWAFALIARRNGVVAQEIEAAGLTDLLPAYPTKHDARAALRHR